MIDRNLSGCRRVAHHVALRRLVIALVGASICASPMLACAQGNPLRDVFFGETHIHTSWSFDAYVFGNTLTGPEDAYQFALGKPIRHPAGYMVQLKRPLDFAAVTDHWNTWALSVSPTIHSRT